MDLPFDVPLDFGEQIQRLPEKVRPALKKLLHQLQDNPDSPSILGEQDPTGRIGYEFFPGYVLYWRVDRKGLHKPIGIRVIEVRKI